MAKLFFNQKLFHFFCQNVPSSIIRKCIYTLIIWYTVYLMGNTVDFFTLYGRDCKGKTMAKHGEMR